MHDRSAMERGAGAVVGLGHGTACADRIFGLVEGRCTSGIDVAWKAVYRVVVVAPRSAGDCTIDLHWSQGREPLLTGSTVRSRKRRAKARRQAESLTPH